jgi:3-isopropylmalate dehydrogenase
MILSVAMMVQWVADKQGHKTLRQAGDAMTAAVDAVLVNPATRTLDIGGTMGCQAFAQAVADAVKSV